MLYAWMERLAHPRGASMSYKVCDSDGNVLSAGIEDVIARGTAQAIANRRGESVWLSSEDDLARVFAGTSLGEEITPEEEGKPGQPIRQDVRTVPLSWREMGLVIAALQSQASNLYDADDQAGGAECRQLAERLMRIRKALRDE
jgi:hypothetical protein